MRININQFRRKVEHLDKSWLFLKHMDDLTGKQRQVLAQYGISDSDNIVLVNFTNEDNWFLVTLSGIYIYKGTLRFINYNSIINFNISIDFKSIDRGIQPKIAADTLKIGLKNEEELCLTCLDIGAVYTLYRAVSYGVNFIATKN